MMLRTSPHPSNSIEEVVSIIRDAAKLPASIPIHAGSHLIEDLRIDSLDLIGVILQIQDHFDVVIDEDLVPTLCRVGELAEFIGRLRKPGVLS